MVTGTKKPGSYNFDKKFLLQQDSSLIELSYENSSVLVSARYQGKVFTSTSDMDKGRSFGWINYKAFSAPIDRHMNAYGGENRLWLGPEGGRYSLFFKKGDTMLFNNWRTPAAFDTEPWNISKKDKQSVTLNKNMKLVNYTGSVLSLEIERTIRMEEKEEIEELFSIELLDSVEFVGYATINILRNTGKFAWNDSTGMPCIWILDMFNPSPQTTIVIPYKPATERDTVATTNYFGEPGSDRLRFDSSIVYFKADGRKRGKIGILPKYALPVAGSYDAVENVLTVTYFSVDSTGRYLNQLWNTTSSTYSGDAVNAYNDGPLANGTQMGPFYEIESVSPAAFLQPRQELAHHHNVYHFTGSRTQLDSIAKKIFGVDTKEIEEVWDERE